MENKKNPILIGLLTALPSLIGSIGSLIKDKRKGEPSQLTDTTPHTTTAEAVVNSIKDAASGTISLKRTSNLIGTGIIIAIAVSDIGAHGITKLNLALICIGAGYSVAMSLLTYLSERK